MADPKRDRAPERGVPDGLLVGALLFLIGLTLLTWTATGLAGLFAHGAWPENVSFIRTPLAARHLVGDPRDLATAWPHTPPAQLSGYGLFWGIFISEVLILVVATVFVVGTLARYRLLRARRAAERQASAAERGAPVEPRERRTEPTAPHPPVTGPVEALPEPGVPRATPAPVAEPQPPVDPAAYFTAVFPTTRPEPAQPSDPAPPDPGDHAAAATLQPPSTPTAAEAAPAPPEARPTAPYATGAAPGGVPAQRGATWSGAESSPARVRFDTPEGRQETALHAILEAPGPLLVTSGDARLWAETTGTRAKLGPVHVYDPSHLLDTPARLRWNPTTGCEAREVAAARSVALLAPVRPASLIESTTADAAETLLRCWLHAAAVDGRPFRQVHRWAQGHSAHEPVRILRTNAKAASGMAGELESTLTAHPERRELARELTARALGALSSIHIRDACNAGRADVLALDSLIAEGGTLYVVGESLENPRSEPGAMPLLTALVASVVEHGRCLAERSPGRRLDPPLTLVLDDVAGVAPFPALPELVAGGSARGLLALALMRSPEQARARWPRTHGSLVG
ncbi:type VI secretion protein [Streptomyces sp. NPDC057702]|uniref:type VI secretion protein n=1 Tax=unclassified Streptomyces TaxID=2593676 RepID=UPI00368C68EF